jgi:hypothetical protein
MRRYHMENLDIDEEINIKINLKETASLTN